MSANASLRTTLILAMGMGFLSIDCAALAAASDTCFAASKTYRIQSVHDGAAIKDGWAVKDAAFPKCVRRAEAAEKRLHAQYPDDRYELVLTATVGCHAPC
jgi:hypothetical protein